MLLLKEQFTNLNFRFKAKQVCWNSKLKILILGGGFNLIKFYSAN